MASLGKHHQPITFLKDIQGLLEYPVVEKEIFKPVARNGKRVIILRNVENF